MDLSTKVKEGGLAIRVPLDVIRKRPTCVGHVLGMVLELPLAILDAYTFSYGWTDPQTQGIIILAQSPKERLPVLMECTWVRKYNTLVKVYAPGV